MFFEYIVLIYPTYDKNKTYRDFAKGDRNVIVLMPDANNQDEIDELLDCCITLFSGTNTLIVLVGCAVSQDLKKRSNKFIKLAFSGRHFGISWRVLTQQLTSIGKPFRDNIVCVVAFHNPSQVGTKTLWWLRRRFGSRFEKEACWNIEIRTIFKIMLLLKTSFECYLKIPKTWNTNLNSMNLNFSRFLQIFRFWKNWEFGEFKFFYRFWKKCFFQDFPQPAISVFSEIFRTLSRALLTNFNKF